MKASDLLVRMNAKTFKPFRVYLRDQSTIEVVVSNMVVGLSSAVLPTVWTKDEDGHRVVKHWRTISFDHIVQIGDIDETVDNKHRKRK